MAFPAPHKIHQPRVSMGSYSLGHVFSRTCFHHKNHEIADSAETERESDLAKKKQAAKWRARVDTASKKGTGADNFILFLSDSWDAIFSWTKCCVCCRVQPLDLEVEIRPAHCHLYEPREGSGYLPQTIISKLSLQVALKQPVKMTIMMMMMMMMMMMGDHPSAPYGCIWVIAHQLTLTCYSTNEHDRILSMLRWVCAVKSFPGWER